MCHVKWLCLSHASCYQIKQSKPFQDRSGILKRALLAHGVCTPSFRSPQPQLEAQKRGISLRAGKLDTGCLSPVNLNSQCLRLDKAAHRSHVCSRSQSHCWQMNQSAMRQLLASGIQCSRLQNASARGRKQQPGRVNTAQRCSCRWGCCSGSFFCFPATRLNDLEWFTENNRKGGNIPNWVIVHLLAEKADGQSGGRGPWSSKDLYPSSPTDL